MTSDTSEYRGFVTQKAVLTGPDDQILLVRGGPNRTWTVPGGRIQGGEDPDVALLRELREETGLPARVGPPIVTTVGVFHTDTGEPMVGIIYACETDHREVELSDEHDEYLWASPETAADRLPVPVLRKAVTKAIDVEV